MNGIDAGTAALLATRTGALGPAGSQGSTGATQAGVSALATGPALPETQAGGAPQASAQTALSAVALALDAIIRSGGDATPAVVGQAPVWADPDSSGSFGQQQPGMAGAAAAVVAAEIEAIESGLLAQESEGTGADSDAASAFGSSSASASADGAAGLSASGDAQAAGGSASSGSSAAGSAGAVTQAAVQSGPVAALAAALAQTVSGSGLFYESHLAQWLLGQRTPAELAGEPQNQLTGHDGQPSAAARPGAGEVEDVLWSEGSAAGARDSQPGGQANPAARYASFQDDGATAAQTAAILRANSARAEIAQMANEPDAGATGSGVQAAVIPLVRQQLDLLATGEFRWTGEAWAGARLDWTVQQDRVDSRDARRGASADPVDAPWRTRLTLSLPLLGTVDAELTLAGDALAVRVQANPDGAQQLVGGSDALRQRLEALGIALTGLSIREVGGSAPGSAEASKAASAAYARAAADERTAHTPGAAAATSTATTAAAAAGAGSDAAARGLDWEL